MFVNSDFSDLLRLFNANGVGYLVLDGCAVIACAEPQDTKDPSLGRSRDLIDVENLRGVGGDQG